jgi:general secretion pathway protein J
MKRVLGFTLLELLLAMAIFALVAAMAYTGLSRMIDQRERLADGAEAFDELVDAVALLESDLRQHALRPARSTDGVLQLAFTGDDRQLEFSRAAMTQAEPLAPLIGRVAWQWQGRELQRLAWPALDRAPSATPLLEAVLSDVTELRFGYRDSAGVVHNRWPNDQASGDLLAVELWLSSGAQPAVRRLVLITPSPMRLGVFDAPS